MASDGIACRILIQNEQLAQVNTFPYHHIIKTGTGRPVEESIRMTEDRHKCRKYVCGVANPQIEDD